MLRIADEKPEVIQRCLKAVVQLTNEGVFKPALAKAFNVSDIGAAHAYLEQRKSMGKIAVLW